jgi:hypothetical protein
MNDIYDSDSEQPYNTAIPAQRGRFLNGEEAAEIMPVFGAKDEN